MKYTIEEEVLIDLITCRELVVGSGIVEDLSKLRDDIEDINAKNILKKYINKYSEKYKICKNCFTTLTPVVIKEAHTELDYVAYETFVDYYKCDFCESKYEY